MPLEDQLSAHPSPPSDPARAGRADDPEVAVQQPRTPMEDLVAGVFAELIGCPPDQLGADFFELGGHSMLAVRAVHEFTEKTGVELELETFFDLGTVEDIAAELDRLLAAGQQVAHEGEI